MNEPHMNRGRICLRWGAFVTAAIILSMFACSFRPSNGWTHAGETDERDESQTAGVPESAAEARGRARLLHETIHGALQVVHRDFFSEEHSRMIPSRSLEDVFSELEQSHKVRVRWLAVNANAMNVDNKPRDAFEEAAVKAIAAGAQEHESIENGTYRYAGRIRLASQCLKCHLPLRTSTKERAAGLVISMPLQQRDPQ